MRKNLRNILNIFVEVLDVVIQEIIDGSKILYRLENKKELFILLYLECQERYLISAIVDFF